MRILEDLEGGQVNKIMRVSKRVRHEDNVWLLVQKEVT